MMMPSRIAAVDTNVLVYAEGFGDEFRSTRALEVFQTLSKGPLIIPFQVCVETLQVLTRKMGVPRHEASQRLNRWRTYAEIPEVTALNLETAASLIETTNFQVFDCLILATAHLAGASLLVSEDMTDGFSWRGVTVVNPFATPLHPTLRTTLDALERPS
jgi:predicted nucleic acid-binding protein